MAAVQMQLTRFSDYALRVLMYAHNAGDRLVTIEEIATAHAISRAHLMKVASTLTRAGLLAAVRGRSGGLKLARPAERIRLGDVVRATEPDFTLVECFEPRSDRCRISACCRLSGVLDEALAAFLAVLDRHTLADVALKPRDWRRLSDPVAAARTGLS